jgi:hypothetical protein
MQCRIGFSLVGKRGRRPLASVFLSDVAFERDRVLLWGVG